MSEFSARDKLGKMSCEKKEITFYGLDKIDSE